MTTPLVFEKGALMQWNNNKISDHNRSKLSIGVERIETPKRMANGTRRTYVVADKRSFSVSWSDLPHIAAYTVDGFWGGQEIEAWYNTQVGPFTLKITNGDGTTKLYTVMMTNFSKDVTKRGLYEFWDIDVEMVEV